MRLNEAESKLVMVDEAVADYRVSKRQSTLLETIRIRGRLIIINKLWYLLNVLKMHVALKNELIRHVLSWQRRTRCRQGSRGPHVKLSVAYIIDRVYYVCKTVIKKCMDLRAAACKPMWHNCRYQRSCAMRTAKTGFNVQAQRPSHLMSA